MTVGGVCFNESERHQYLPRANRGMDLLTINGQCVDFIIAVAMGPGWHRIKFHERWFVPHRDAQCAQISGQIVLPAFTTQLAIIDGSCNFGWGVGLA